MYLLLLFIISYSMNYLLYIFIYVVFIFYYLFKYFGIWLRRLACTFISACRAKPVGYDL